MLIIQDIFKKGKSRETESKLNGLGVGVGMVIDYKWA